MDDPTLSADTRGRMYDVGRSQSTDYFGLREQLSEDELELLLRTRAYVDDEVLPVIGGLLGAGGVPVRPGPAARRARPGRRRHRRATAARR